MNNRRNSGKEEVYGKRNDGYHYITGKIEMIGKKQKLALMKK
ncbi:hypothetical protein [Leptotrichia trevisanii]|nr:hypothetical protein [Leptotrichia trevisanii]